MPNPALARSPKPKPSLAPFADELYKLQGVTGALAPVPCEGAPPGGVPPQDVPGELLRSAGKEEKPLLPVR